MLYRDTMAVGWKNHAKLVSTQRAKSKRFSIVVHAITRLWELIVVEKQPEETRGSKL